jgi:predicted RNase H-like nuclease
MQRPSDDPIDDREPETPARPMNASLDAAHGRLVGADGCRGGWVVATRDHVSVARNLSEIVADATISCIGIDMPIGLPETWGRLADSEARQFLKPRSACIFTTPPRSLVHLRSYAEANARCRLEFGRGLPRQTFNLFGKIREVDALADPARPDRLVEVHPECAFVALSGRPLPPKRTAIGRDVRRRLLENIFGTIVAKRVPQARPDDVLDAFAALWSTERFARCEHMTHGGRHRDGRGLPMRIVT